MQLKQIFLNIAKTAGTVLALFLMCLVGILVILWIGFTWGEDDELYGWPIGQTYCPTPACDQH